LRRLPRSVARNLAGYHWFPENLHKDPHGLAENFTDTATHFVRLSRRRISWRNTAEAAHYDKNFEHTLQFVNFSKTRRKSEKLHRGQKNRWRVKLCVARVRKWETKNARSRIEAHLATRWDVNAHCAHTRAPCATYHADIHAKKISCVEIMDSG